MYSDSIPDAIFCVLSQTRQVSPQKEEPCACHPSINHNVMQTSIQDMGNWSLFDWDGEHCSVVSTGETRLGIRSQEHAAFWGKNIEKGIVLSASIIMRCGVLQVWVLSFLNPSLSSSHTPSGMWQQHLYECVCNENLRKEMGKLQSETNDDL